MSKFAYSLFLLVAWTQSVDAKTYYCTLTDLSTVSDDGGLQPHPLRDSLRNYQVTIEVETGKVFHPEFGTSTYDVIQVLDYGSKISALKVIAYSKESSRPEEGVASFRNATYFEIETYAETVKKPFLAVTAGNVGQGVCE